MKRVLAPLLLSTVLSTANVFTGADIFFLHVSKAAGTTICGWMQKMGKHTRCHEGLPINEHLHSNLLATPKMLKVISLREPVSRVKSLLNMFVQRQRLNGVDASIKGEFKRMNREIGEGSHGCQSARSDVWPNIAGQMYCISDIYLKVLTGTSATHKSAKEVEPFMYGDVDQSTFEFAKRRLEEFDLIIIVEMLKDRDHMTYVKRVLGVESATDIPKGNEAYHVGGYLKFSKKEISTIKKMNTWDAQLYDFAKSLAKKRMRGNAEL